MLSTLEATLSVDGAPRVAIGTMAASTVMMSGRIPSSQSKQRVSLPALILSIVFISGSCRNHVAGALGAAPVAENCSQRKTAAGGRKQATTAATAGSQGPQPQICGPCFVEALLQRAKTWFMGL